MRIWTLRAKPKESKFLYLPAMRCMTNLNYESYLEANYMDWHKTRQ